MAGEDLHVHMYMIQSLGCNPRESLPAMLYLFCRVHNSIFVCPTLATLLWAV